MCIWIREKLGDDVPLHFNRFFPAYRMADASPTPVKRIERAHQMAKEEQLKYVFIGNVPGHQYNSSFCHRCSEVLIQRHHFSIQKNNMENGSCPFCGEQIPGVWEKK